jgi:hypothetical protein
MLAVGNYSHEHVDRTRRRIEADTAAFASAGAFADAEAAFFNNMVLALDHYFLHRVRKLEGKDGNPLNEVRVLCASLVENDGVFTADGTIKLKPEETVLGLELGDAIRLSEDDFRRLAEGFLAEIEARYS